MSAENPAGFAAMSDQELFDLAGQGHTAYFAAVEEVGASGRDGMARNHAAGIAAYAAVFRGALAKSAASLSFEALQIACSARNFEWHGLHQPDLLFRATELGGEVGEALNVVKKLARERMGAPGSRATVEDLADELADAVICVVNLAVCERIDLGAALVRKFNATSEKMGLETKLPDGLAEPGCILIRGRYTGGLDDASVGPLVEGGAL
jgi:NTP pyrophosphatase (non-canonical NTP hydrolase)